MRRACPRMVQMLNWEVCSTALTLGLQTKTSKAMRVFFKGTSLQMNKVRRSQGLKKVCRSPSLARIQSFFQRLLATPKKAHLIQPTSGRVCGRICILHETFCDELNYLALGSGRKQEKRCTQHSKY